MKYGLIGERLGHSFSKIIHEKLGKYQYELCEIAPEELDAFIDALAEFSNLRIRGLMTIAPKCDEKADYLKYFQQTYAQVIDIWQKKLHNIDRPIISMGMSDSFEEAIASGSDIVRVGRGLFVK